tara:strand:- start:143 stop:418 length:276 start_codon:yes stop_codon:yes gene_type:complete
MIEIRDWDIEYMCSDNQNLKYSTPDVKRLCNKYNADKLVTQELLEMYALSQIETFGDMREGIIEFSYGDIIIKGEWVDGDEYPARILKIDE